MPFDYISNIRSHRTVACTRDIMQVIMRSTIVTQTCAEIADCHEMKLRGEMSREDFDTKKTELKKRLPAFCFHAHFKSGRRLNADAVPSGLSIYDLDHISDPRGRWAEIAPPRNGPRHRACPRIALTRGAAPGVHPARRQGACRGSAMARSAIGRQGV